MTLCQVTKQQCENNEQRRTYKNVKKASKQINDIKQQHQLIGIRREGSFFSRQCNFYMKNTTVEKEEKVAKRNDAIMCIHIYILNYIVASN